MANTRYEQCLTAMYRLRRFGIKLGLETIKTVLTYLGNPQNDYQIVHIAGTNGKGSVAAILSNLLQMRGFRVGRYTSPHLECFNERICIDNEPIKNEAIISAYNKVYSAPQLERELTFFEYTTAMALHEFSERKVDWAVIETGMGGRLDATNAVCPSLTIITNISLEHKSYLGDTIAAIASEKAGIIKPSIPLVTAVTQDSARSVIMNRATELESTVYLKDRDFSCRRSKNNRFSYYGISESWYSLELGLRGDHQIENAALALAAYELLLQYSKREHIPEEKIRKTLVHTQWPGRLEVVSSRPFVLLDGAHNLIAARKLAQYLKQQFKDRHITLIIGVLNDKPYDAMLKDLIEPSNKVVVTQPVIDRAVPAHDLAKAAQKYTTRVEIAPDVTIALEKTIQNSHAEDVICVAGSLYVVGEAKKALKNILAPN